MHLLPTHISLQTHSPDLHQSRERSLVIVAWTRPLHAWCRCWLKWNCWTTDVLEMLAHGVCYRRWQYLLPGKNADVGAVVEWFARVLNRRRLQLARQRTWRQLHHRPRLRQIRPTERSCQQGRQAQVNTTPVLIIHHFSGHFSGPRKADGSVCACLDSNFELQVFDIRPSS